MVETFAVAYSPDKTHLVVCRNNRHYAIIERRKGITKDTSWKDKTVLSSALVKGGYKKFKNPMKYKGINKDSRE